MNQILEYASPKQEEERSAAWGAALFFVWAPLIPGVLFFVLFVITRAEEFITFAGIACFLGPFCMLAAVVLCARHLATVRQSLPASVRWRRAGFIALMIVVNVVAAIDSPRQRQPKRL